MPASTATEARTRLREARRRPGSVAVALALLAALAGRQCYAVKPSAQEMAATRRWVAAAFPGEAGAATAAAERAAEVPPGEPGLVVLRQTAGTFRVDRSVWNRPLRMADKVYPHGLGTHAQSEILVRLPGPGAKFTALAGVDENNTTAGGQGSVVFAVEVGGRKVYTSPLLRGDQPPVRVEADLGGARELTLRVGDGGDGFVCDQADWAEATVTLTDGRRVPLDELPLLKGQTSLAGGLPFSFVYGGKASAELLPKWRREATAEPCPGGTLHRISWSDPATGLRVTCKLRVFDDFPAADWVLEFSNEGKTDTPILEHVLPLDATVAMPEGELVDLHHAKGSSCAIDDFEPLDDPLVAGQPIAVAPVGGRSSNGALPFFNVDWGTGGVVLAVGWSGQWAATFDREQRTALRMEAGMERMRLKLHPGETIRTPRILAVLWEGGDWLRGQNLLRRLLIAHYLPRYDGKLQIPPVAYNSAQMCLRHPPADEALQLRCVRAAHAVGCEAFWLDAYWFPKGFPGGVGSWRARPKDYPHGLRPIADAAHADGMKFILWFEPERVAPGSDIDREHPEFLLRLGGGDRLFNLGDPAARKWMTDLLSRRIEEWGVDVYREDFNIDPLPFWEAADKTAGPDREGITEIRFVEGLYKMWGDLLRRHPGLAIDNCASGGRRIDLETLSLSYPLWRSDWSDAITVWNPDHDELLPAGQQVQTAGLSLWAPLSACGLYRVEPYFFRSGMTTGAVLYGDMLAPSFPRELARRDIAELKALRPYMLEDFYPLMPVTPAKTDWAAWQYDAPDLGGGVAFVFRRPSSPYSAAQVGLRALDAGATYRVTRVGEDGVPHEERITGAALARLEVRIEEAPGSVMVKYQKSGGS